MPDVAARYALPPEAEALGLRRYGFHGNSFASLVETLPKLSGTPLPTRLLALHLGNGASLCAIREGQSVATTMGYSPLCGLTMGTRVGTIDGDAVLALAARVGIARAMVKNAKIYIYDEATSALDGANERAIMQAAVDSAKDSTILFVTHRPSTLQWVDRVLLLDHGRVVAFETHETLMETNAIYRALFNLNISDEERA